MTDARIRLSSAVSGGMTSCASCSAVSPWMVMASGYDRRVIFVSSQRGGLRLGSVAVELEEQG
jgi:hypothetical protein